MNKYLNKVELFQTFKSEFFMLIKIMLILLKNKKKTKNSDKFLLYFYNF